MLPYRVVKNRHFTTRNKIRKKYRPKGIVALYYYYRYLLKLYTKKNIQYKLTPEMRAEVKKMDEYSERIRFLCKYKIETMSDVDNIKEQKQEELQKILNIRNRLYYKRQKLNSGIEKDMVTKEIIDVTATLTRFRKEIRLCDKFYDDVPKMKEQIKEVDDKEKQNTKEKEEKNLKRKKDDRLINQKKTSLPHVKKYIFILTCEKNIKILKNLRIYTCFFLFFSKIVDIFDNI